jgi:hypothetical protein
MNVWPNIQEQLKDQFDYIDLDHSNESRLIGGVKNGFGSYWVVRIVSTNYGQGFYKSTISEKPYKTIRGVQQYIKRYCEKWDNK